MHVDGWTLALQAINFLILVLLLRHFLYRPVLAAIDRRRAEAGRMLDDAAAAAAQAEAVRREAAAARAGLDAEAQRLRAAARAAADREAEARLARARAETDALLADARKRLEEERQAALATLRARAVGLAGGMATALLRTAAPGAAVEPFLARVCGRLDALPEAERRSLRAQAAEGVRIVTASPLDAAAQARCRAALLDALGVDGPVAFADDQALLAGVEVHFTHTVIRDSWRDALERLGLEVDGHADALERA
ncbi:F0F1 ATP synthase subunit B family protein [Azospirillum sp. ST 5-10]|uniref:F0F1 ATP synthase subunit B family protein n=1 Tax=unclassified Azospirillum TaxID=2630922 RepID=UPI003F4A51AA